MSHQHDHLKVDSTSPHQSGFIHVLVAYSVVFPRGTKYRLSSLLGLPATFSTNDSMKVLGKRRVLSIEPKSGKGPWTLGGNSTFSKVPERIARD